MLKFNISRFMILQKANSVNSTRAISKKYVSFQSGLHVPDRFSSINKNQ